jgi:putative ABC transport system permease protein
VTPRLPRLARWLIRRAARPALAEDVLGDLEEAWRDGASSRLVGWFHVLRLSAAVYWHGRRDLSEPTQDAARLSVGRAALQDARLAVRLLVRRPRHSAAAILTLALGIGASTAILTAARTVVVPTLPYPDASRLVHIWASWPGGFGNLSYPDFEGIRQGAPALDDVAAYESWGSVAMGAGDRPVHLTPMFVSPRYLPMLGATAATGRLLDAFDHVQGAPSVAILSPGLWQRQFARDPRVIGRVVTLNGAPYTIVGVMSPRFADLGQAEEPPADIWLPAVSAQALLGQPPLTEVSRIFWAVGHLGPGETIARLREQLDAVSARFAAQRPATHRGYQLNARPLHNYLYGGIALPARLLIAGSLLMLLIGCANVANLTLARAAERRGEFAVRVAIGASRGRMLRQALVESLVLVSAGGGVGLLFAVGVTRALATFVQTRVSPFVSPRGDLAAFAVSAALTLVTCIGVGMAPALAAARTELREAANLTGRWGARLAKRRLRAALVSAEVGVAVILLVSAGLLTRSVQQLVSSGLGFRTDHLLTFRLDLSGDRYAQADARVGFADAFVQTAQAIPGVESATIWGPSMLGRATWVASLLPEGRPADRPDAFTQAFFHATSPGGLHNLGIALTVGREFSSFDTATSTPVAIISESLAREFWPEGGAVSRRLRRSDPRLPLLAIVGIARDARHRERFSLADIGEGLAPPGLAPQRDLYIPYAQRPAHAMTVAVRAADASGTADRLRDAIAALDPGLAVDDVRTLDDRIAEQNSAPAALAALMGAYALMAVLLAGVGLYGVVACTVQERTREIGIRLALGAQTRTVLGLIVRNGAWPVLTGLATGLLGAAALSRLVRTLLYGVAPTDLVTFAAVPVLLAGIALVAMWAPVLRAGRIDPIVALREP